MKMKNKLNQYRRDFAAVYECENCNEERTLSGYDDRNFHDNVIPSVKCRECGKSTNDLGIEAQYIETEYPEGYQI